MSVCIPTYIVRLANVEIVLGKHVVQYVRSVLSF